VTALNKVDKLLDADGQVPSLECLLEMLGDAAPLAVNPVAISAESGLGFDTLLGAVEVALEEEAQFVPVVLNAPFSRSDLVDLFHRLGRVEDSEFTESGSTLRGHLPQAEIGRFAPYLETGKPGAPLAQPAATRAAG
jgi:50S ribosomal subunit-associated GTPase HflX